MFLERFVPRIERLTRAELSGYFEAQHEPVVISQLASGWPAVARWSADYLDHAAGHLEVGVKRSGSFKHPDFHGDDPGARGKISLRSYLRTIAQSPDERQRTTVYLSGDENAFFQDGQANPHLASLGFDFTLPDLVDESRLTRSALWLGGGGIFSWLHFDRNYSHNLNVQVAGRKRFLLFPPESIARLYPFTREELPQAYNFSKIDLTAPDHVRFPESRGLGYREAILERGDALFIPATWFHAVFHEGDLNINVNFWWRPVVCQGSRLLRCLELYRDFYGAPG